MGWGIGGELTRFRAAFGASDELAAAVWAGVAEWTLGTVCAERALVAADERRPVQTEGHVASFTRCPHFKHG